MKKSLSIVIVTFRSNDLIYDCLRSIFMFNDLCAGLEVIIVDNSDEETFINLKRLINKDFGPTIKLIWSGTNSGYGTANNLGVNHANSEIILVMNPDVRLFQKCFKLILKEFTNNSNLSLYGCKEYDENLKIKNSFFYKMEYHTIFNVMILNKIFNILNIFNANKMYLNGAFFFVRKSHFTRIGGFDENIFLYAEEPDLARRLTSLNPSGLIKFNRSIGYIHLKKKSPNSARTIEYAIESAVYYLTKFGFDVNKYLKSRYQYSKIKQFLALLACRNEEANTYKYISQHIKTKHLNKK